MLPPDDVQLAEQPALQRSWQSVVQLVVGAQVVVHELSHVEVQVASAAALHCEVHCCSSFAAQHLSNVSGVHFVVHALCVSSLHWALALISILPHAAMPAWAGLGATVKAATPIASIEAGRARRARRGWRTR